MKIVPVILSGGSGTRLWPLSRAGHPKQLRVLCGDQTMLQQTVLRLPPDITIAPPIVICNQDHRFMIAEQMRAVGVTPSAIVLEPVARSTAPAIAIAALLAEAPQDTVLAVMPADHCIDDPNGFLAAIRQAAHWAMQGYLMTLGVAPTKPHTGFGYIETGDDLSPPPARACVVTSFTEKPDAETAKTYLDSGRYLWNAGIFVFRADVYMAEVEKLHPAMAQACRAALQASAKDLDFLRLDEAAFASSPNLSVDYAIMEKADKIGVIPVSFGWNDVGGWQALWDLGAKDADGNVLSGDVIVSNVKNSYIAADRRLVATLGLQDVVIVDMPDALLVAAKDKVDDVKNVVAALMRQKRPEAMQQHRVWRPWGFYESINDGPRYQAKRIMVKPGARLSLQMHHHRAEHWIVVSGSAKVTRGDEIKLLGPDQSIYIPLGVKHRIENPGKVPLYIIEVQSGDYLGEDDIIRFEDDYRREA